ncbi:MAG: NADP-dependent oxidoreductase [Luminiphilus sp.]|nr:NADP-dependent oxidoreductase [Luminiphilus sp.]
MVNRQVVLAAHPRGVPTASDFRLVEAAVPTAGPGQMVVRNLYLSLEAAIRSWLDGTANYFEPIALGGAIRGPSIARVETSQLPGFKPGDLIFGLHQWEDYSVSDANTVLLRKLTPNPVLPLSLYAGALGGSGQTAYVGLHSIGGIQSGNTVLVSAAAGATGSMACQIAALEGCRVVGIVGTDEKSEVVRDELGADAAINYRTEPDLAAALTRTCPEGVNVYFDNVGGTTLDAALMAMAQGGRIVGCGMISDYNNAAKPTPLYNLWQVVERQLTLQGFLLYSYLDALPAASAALESWLAAGRLKALENITEGLSGAGGAYSAMMAGTTMGKNLVSVDEAQ